MFRLEKEKVLSIKLCKHRVEKFAEKDAKKRNFSDQSRLRKKSNKARLRKKLSLF
jgi:hypothetical protein